MLFLILLTSPSDACSCLSVDPINIDSCEDSAVVYGGRVAGYQWPPGPSAKRDRLVVGLQVDQVWRGEVSERVFTRTGWGGGDCGIHPTPGTPFLVCQATNGPPSFHLCSAPPLGAHAQFLAEGLLNAMGPASAATPWVPPGLALALRGSAWEIRTLFASALLSLFLALLLGAGSRPLWLQQRSVRWSTAGSMASLAALGLWLLWCTQGRNPWMFYQGPSLGLITLSTVGGWFIGRGQTQVRRQGLLSAVFLGAVFLALLVKQHRGSMAWDVEESTCNAARALTLLESPGSPEDTYNAWQESRPESCGSEPFWPSQRGQVLCLSVDDQNMGRTTWCDKPGYIPQHGYASTRRRKRPAPFNVE